MIINQLINIASSDALERIVDVGSKIQESLRDRFDVDLVSFEFKGVGWYKHGSSVVFIEMSCPQADGDHLYRAYVWVGFDPIPTLRWALDQPVVVSK